MLKTIVRQLLNSVGYDVSRIRRSGPVYGLEPFYKVLVAHQFSPRHIIDVGANHGNWTREALGSFPDAEYTLVEPQEYLRAEVDDLIKAGKVHWITAGVGDKEGKMRFTLGTGDDNGSFCDIDGQNKIEVDVMTLDQIAASSGRPIPDMVKVDAEGFDLKVLDGASTLLGKTDIFLGEGLLREGGYENTMARLFAKMESAGYALLDITGFIRDPKNGALWACEFAFIRRGCALFDRIFK